MHEDAQYGIIPAGKQVLDGEKAEWLVRHRKTYTDQDIGRIKIQRLFLASALQQVKKIGVKEVSKMLPAIYGNVTTDLSLAEMKKFASLAFNVDMANVQMFMVPGEGVTYKGQSVWSMHYYETADLLNKYFRPYSDPIEASSLKIVELAHTGEYYENTQDDFQDLIDGSKPGQQKNSDSNLPAYNHVVTQPKQTTTTGKSDPKSTEQTTETVTTVTSPKDNSEDPNTTETTVDSNQITVETTKETTRKTTTDSNN